MVVIKDYNQYYNTVIIFDNTSYIIKNSFSGKRITNYNNNLLSLDYIKNDLMHRYYGPAIIRKKYKSWYFNGAAYGWNDYGYSQKEFIRDIKKKLNKQWLL